MEIAGNCTLALNVKTIKPRHMKVNWFSDLIILVLKIAPVFKIAIDEDYDFHELLESAHVIFFPLNISLMRRIQVVLPGVGVSPRIHAVLSGVLTPDTFRGWNKQGQNNKVLASG